MSEVLKWLLITSITLVSTTLLMFVTTYIAVFNETAAYFDTSVSNVVLLSNTFNIFYLIVSPILFSWLKKMYSIIVKIAIIVIAFGCCVRYFVGNNYTFALASSTLVAIAHIPIISAPYGLLGLFQPSKRGYASSIPLFIPALGINFCILFGMLNITTQFPQFYVNRTQAALNKLNLIIAVLGVFSAITTIFLMNKLNKQIRQINQDSDEGRRDSASCVQQIKNQFTGDYRPFVIVVISWGTILGIHWTYGGMFGIFLDGTGLNRYQIALIGLYANLSSAAFCNLGNWLSNRLKHSNESIIFYLNVVGFLGSLFLQASSALPYQIFHNRTALIIAVILLRAGFSSFVSLALMELNSFGPSVLVSSIFFYVANATNLGGNYMVDLLNSSKSLTIMSGLIWLSIFMVHMVQRTKIDIPTGSLQVFSQQMVSRKDDQQMSESKNLQEQPKEVQESK